MKPDPIAFQNTFDHISPWEIDELLEYLDDCGYLSKEGQRFCGWRLEKY